MIGAETDFLGLHDTSSNILCLEPLDTDAVGTFWQAEDIAQQLDSFPEADAKAWLLLPRHQAKAGPGACSSSRIARSVRCTVQSILPGMHVVRLSVVEFGRGCSLASASSTMRMLYMRHNSTGCLRLIASSLRPQS